LYHIAGNENGPGMEVSSVKRTLHLPDSFLRETFVCGSGDDEWVHLCQGK